MIESILLIIGVSALVAAVSALLYLATFPEHDLTDPLKPKRRKSRTDVVLKRDSE